MTKILFVGLSIAFFGAYVAIANAIGVLGTAPIADIAVPVAPAASGGFLDTLGNIVDAFGYMFSVFSQFFKLITFQLPGQSGASVLTSILFIPLGAINAIIIFTWIRGS